MPSYGLLILSIGVYLAASGAAGTLLLNAHDEARLRADLANAERLQPSVQRRLREFAEQLTLGWYAEARRERVRQDERLALAHALKARNRWTATGLATLGAIWLSLWWRWQRHRPTRRRVWACLLYTSDAADDP